MRACMADEYLRASIAKGFEGAARVGEYLGTGADDPQLPPAIHR